MSAIGKIEVDIEGLRFYLNQLAGGGMGYQIGEQIGSGMAKAWNEGTDLAAITRQRDEAIRLLRTLTDIGITMGDYRAARKFLEDLPK